MESGNTGITYFRIPESKIEDYKKYGDKVINCGLNGSQIDNNFYTLRINDVYGGEVDDDGNLILYRGEGKNMDKAIIIPLNVNADIDLSRTEYFITDGVGVLRLQINDQIKEIRGLSACDSGTVASEFAYIKEGISEIKDNISDNESEIQKNKGEIIKISNSLSKTNSSISSLSGATKESICSIKNDLRALDGRLITTSEKLSELEENVNERLDEDDSKIDQIEKDLSALYGTTKSINTRSLCNQSDISELKETIYNVNTGITHEISSLKEEIHGINGINKDIESIKANIVDISGYTSEKIPSIESHIEGLEQEYANKFTEIDREIDCSMTKDEVRDYIPSLVKWFGNYEDGPDTTYIGKLDIGKDQYLVFAPTYATKAYVDSTFTRITDFENLKAEFKTFNEKAKRIVEDAIEDETARTESTYQKILEAGEGVSIVGNKISFAGGEISGITESKAEELIHNAMQQETGRTEEAYQKILTAGENITIDENNVISAIGGGSGDITRDEVEEIVSNAIDSETARTESTYLKEHQSLEGYATEDWVSKKGYQNKSEVQDLIDESVSDIPTFEEVSNAIDDAINAEKERAESSYAKKEDVNAAIDSETARTEDTYQKILTAGEGVTIEDNVISISGGGDVTKEDLSSLKEEIENEIDNVKDNMSILEASIDKEVENREGLQADLDGKIGNWSEEFSGSTITEEVKKLGKGGVVNIATNTPKWIEIKDDEEKTGKIINFLGIENEEFLF